MPIPQGQPHRPPCRVFMPSEAPARLADLGVDSRVLTGAVVSGHQGATDCTPSHPRQARGQRMWADTVAALRDGLRATDEGWKADSRENFETALHESRRVAIAVMGGNSVTGQFGMGMPAVRRRRGPVAQQFVEQNRHIDDGLMSVDFVLGRSASPKESVAFSLHILLMFATPECIFLELSRPTFAQEGKLVGWSERVLLSPLELGGGVTPIDPEDDGDEPPFSVRAK